MAEQHLKRLDHLQAIVQRLAGNSFLIKSWGISLGSALLGFALKDNTATPQLAYLAILPTLAFWLLDAYYLAAERYFRAAYNRAAENPENQEKIIERPPIGPSRLLGAAFCWVTLLPYLALLICEIAVGAGVFSRIVGAIRS